jgi:hypothetical protein
MRNKKRFRPALALSAALFLLILVSGGCREKAALGPSPKPAPSSEAADAPQRLPTATIRVGAVPLVVELATTEAQRQKGMMFRPSLGPDEAMLFVFPRSEPLRFWMKDTLVDLDLAYIVTDGRIAQIEHMKAGNLAGVPSDGAAQFALELPAGWLAAHQIDVGTRITIPPEVAGE